METGLKHVSRMLVSADKLAVSAGSGDMEVMATPAMLALMENAAMLAVAGRLPAGCTTVGVHIGSNHLRPTPPGAAVTASAELTAVDGRKLTFRIAAYGPDGELLGEGEHMRYIVEREKFIGKMAKRG